MARVAFASRMTTILGLEEAAIVCPSSTSSRPPTTLDHHTWTHPDRRCTLLPLAITLTDATHPLHFTTSPNITPTTSHFVDKELAPVPGSVVPDTTRHPTRISISEDLESRLPPAPPPYSSVPSSLQVGHPVALQPRAPSAYKPGGNDELDRVVSMYYDRRPSDPIADKNWL